MNTENFYSGDGFSRGSISCSLLALAVVLNILAPATAKAQTEVNKLKLFGRIDALSSACSAAGIRLESRQLPTTILKVRLGSPASYAGVLDQDQIESGTISGGTMNLCLKRQGKFYTVVLKIKSEQAVSHSESGARQISSGQKTPGPAFSLALQEKTRQPDWRTLRNYQIAFVVDQSGSMNEGIGSADFSRWQWCCQQIESFASEAQRASADPLSLATFNHDYRVAHKCTAQKIVEILNASRPNGGTEFAGPLRQIISDYLKVPRKHPLLIVMITDGETNSGAAAEKVLVEATNRMTSSNQIKLVIFQIGETGDGADFVRRLDQDLVGSGARFDIVKAVFFDQLWQNGLRHALFKALQDS